jgi:hypothetical protein
MHPQGGRLSAEIITPQPAGLAAAAAFLKGDVMFGAPPGHHMSFRCAMTGRLAARNCKWQQHNMSLETGHHLTMQTACYPAPACCVHIGAYRCSML